MNRAYADDSGWQKPAEWAYRRGMWLAIVGMFTFALMWAAAYRAYLDEREIAQRYERGGTILPVEEP